MKRRFHYSLRFLLLFIPAAILASWLRPRVVDVKLSVDGFFWDRDPVDGQEGYYVRIRITNASRDPAWYRGLHREHPWFLTMNKMKMNGRWAGPGGYRAEPATKVWLSSGESAVFTVPVPPNVIAMKIGVLFGTRRFGEAKHLVWSEVAAVDRHVNRTGPIIEDRRAAPAGDRGQTDVSHSHRSSGSERH